MNSVLLTANVIIRYFTGDEIAKKFLEPVIYGGLNAYINNIVFSEVIFIVIKLLSRKKAYELKESPETVKSILKTMDYQLQFVKEYFTELEVNDEIKEQAIKITRDYGLLPNDSLIVATCKHYSINTILTFDKDFKRVPWLKVIP